MPFPLADNGTYVDRSETEVNKPTFPPPANPQFLEADHA